LSEAVVEVHRALLMVALVAATLIPQEKMVSEGAAGAGAQAVFGPLAATAVMDM
jgi:hypothetical protein